MLKTRFAIKAQLFTTFLLILLPVTSTQAQVTTSALATPAEELPFIRNIGQVDKNVAFHSRGHHGDIFVSADGTITYKLKPNAQGKGWVLREKLVGGHSSSVQPSNLSSTAFYFQHGKTGSTRTARANGYRTLQWENVYPAIDLALKRRSDGVEKILTVEPGGNPQQIRWQMQGVDTLNVNNRGELVADTGLGPVHFSQPVAFQVIDGKRRYVPVHYIVAANTYGFAVGDYDRSRPLMIDPLLASTYLGSSSHDADSAIPQIVHDAITGDVIVAGITLGLDFPTTPGAYDTTHADNSNRDVFVARLSSDLSTLVAASFLGGTGLDTLRGIALNAAGQIALAGDTDSLDFPTTAGVHQTARSSGRDAFISILSSDLSTLVASTLFGDTGSECVSSGSDFVSAMVLDSNGNIIITGNTTSRTLPVTTGAYQTSISTGSNSFPCGHDAYLAKLNPTLTTVLANTYYGTGGANNLTESVSGMVIDGNGNVTISGWAPHDTLPVTVAGGNSNGGTADAYLASFNSDFTSLLNARYLGGSGNDVARSLARDNGNNLYVTGTTSSLDYPTTTGAWLTALPPGTPTNTTYGTTARLNSNLQLSAATYLYRALPYAVHIDASVPGGEVVLVGSSAVDFPYPVGAYDPLTDNLGPQKVLTARLDLTLASLHAGTSLHGQCSLYCNVTTDSSGNVFVVGTAVEPVGRDAIDLTTTAYDTTWNGGSRDLFISKLNANLDGIAMLNAAPGSHDYGTLAVPVTSFTFPSQEFVLTNPGSGWLSITGVTLAGTDPGMFSIEANTCSGDAANLRPQTVLPDANKSCSVTVEFQPFTTQSGTWNATLQITSTDPTNPVTNISLVGRTQSSTSSGGGGSSGGGSSGGSNTTDGGGGGSVLTRPVLPFLIALAIVSLYRRRWRE